VETESWSHPLATSLIVVAAMRAMAHKRIH
jgi:hypothetical protein